MLRRSRRCWCSQHKAKILNRRQQRKQRLCPPRLRKPSFSSLPSVRNPNRIRKNLRCLRLLAKAFGVSFGKKIQTFRVSDHKILRSTSVKGQKITKVRKKKRTK